MTPAEYGAGFWQDVAPAFFAALASMTPDERKAAWSTMLGAASGAMATDVGMQVAVGLLEVLPPLLRQQLGEVPPPMLHVVARTKQQADWFARRNGLGPQHWRYVDNVEAMRPLRGARVVFYGDWQERPDARQLVEQARARGCEIINP